MIPEDTIRFIEDALTGKHPGAVQYMEDCCNFCAAEVYVTKPEHEPDCPVLYAKEILEKLRA